jgi:hypothetical protein
MIRAGGLFILIMGIGVVLGAIYQGRRRLLLFPAPRVSVYDIGRHPGVQLPPGMRAFDKDPT